MSLKPLETHITANQSLYAPYTTTGGGGGGGSSVVTSSLTVSTLVGLGGAPIEVPTEMSISSIAGPNPNGTLVQNGFEFLPGAPILFDTKPAPADDITFNGNDGAIAGLSTINGAPYPPPGSGAAISTIITGGTTVGSAPVNLVGAGPTLSTGKVYLFSATFDSPSQGVIGAPTEGDHAGFVLPDSSIPYMLDLAQFSSIKGKGQPLGYSFSAPFVAGAGAFQLSAYCSAAATASTFVGTSAIGWITPLN